MKSESAKQAAEDRQRNATTSRKSFLKANGWMLIKIISMVFIALRVPPTGDQAVQEAPNRTNFARAIPSKLRCPRKLIVSQPSHGDLLLSLRLVTRLFIACDG